MAKFRTLLLLLVLLPALLPAQELFKGAVPMKLPFPPGERQVTRLILMNDMIIGVVAGEKGAVSFFRTGNAATGEIIVETPPVPVTAELAALLANDARPLVPDLQRQCGYTLNDAGKLVRFTPFGKTTELGQVAGTRPFEKEGYQLSRALVPGPDGALYTAGANGAIFRFDPAADKLEKLAAVLPAVKGREAWASLDAAVFAPDGLMYGGTYDGYLFTFDPKTEAVMNLGKPFRAQRIQGLVFRQGLLIGIGGDEDGIPRAFAFNPATRVFTLGGPLPGGIAPNNYEPVNNLLLGPDGNVYYSTTGRMANLFVWKP